MNFNITSVAKRVYAMDIQGVFPVRNISSRPGTRLAHSTWFHIVRVVERAAK